MSTWFLSISAFATDIGLPSMDSWLKSKIRVSIDSYLLDQYQQHRTTHHSMLFMRDYVVPKVTNRDFSDSKLDWWLKVKMGGCLLYNKMHNIAFCPVCEECICKTPVHFLHDCSALEPSSPEIWRHLLQEAVAWAPLKRLEWMMQDCRNYMQHSIFGALFKGRWKAHEMIIALRHCWKKIMWAWSMEKHLSTCIGHLGIVQNFFYIVVEIFSFDTLFTKRKW